MASSCWERNLAALQQHHPQLAAAVRAIQEVPAVTVGKNAADEAEILCRFADGTARPYYGAASIAKETERLVAEWPLKNPRVLLFLGLGLGYHLLAHLRHPHPLNRALLVLEPSPHIFRRALECHDFSAAFADPRIRWCIGDDVDAVRRFLGQVFIAWPTLVYANAVEFVQLPPAAALFPKYMEQVRAMVPEVIGHCYSRYFGDPYDAFLGIQNTLANLPLLAGMPLFDGARGVLRGRPGIVIASGPSLTPAIPALRTLQDRAVMVACPSALPRLLADGIAPHLWLNVERLENQGTFLESLPSHPPHLFVGPALVHPRCWQGNGGDNVHILGGSLLAHWLGLDGERRELGHSSAHAAFQLLQTLGCDPIYLVGQDLSYDAAQSHAGGVWEASAQMMQQVRDGKRLPIEGNNGQTIETNIYWYTYLKTFTEVILPQHRGRVAHVIAADQGAKIAGTTRLDPAALAEQVDTPVADLLGALRAALPTPSAVEQRRRRAHFAARIDETIAMLHREAEHGQAFALTAKQLPFREPFILHDWTRAQPEYETFLAAAEAYAQRFHDGPRIRPDYRCYLDFLHPLVQGALLRYQIEFHTGAEDRRGHFPEIARKAELMYHMAKDEAFWAQACLPLLTAAKRTLTT